MSDIEERPSKIRKVNLSDNLKEPHETPSANPSHDDKSKPEDPHDQSKDGQDGTPQVDNQRGTEGSPPLSKNQLKKLRKQEQWEAGKDFRRARRREKHKERQLRKAEQRAASAQEAANGGTEILETLSGTDKKHRPLRPIQVPVTFIMDCDFNELMTEKELISLGAQLTRCYSDNRSSPYRSHMVISSWQGKLKTRFETVLDNHHLGWKGVRFVEGDFVAAAEELDAVMRGPDRGKLVGALSVEREKDAENKPEKFAAENAAIGESSTKSKAAEEPVSELSNPAPGANGTEPAASANTPSIVYLTSDSPYTLDKLSPNTSYIVGGIVDKNRHKGICYKRACQRGIATAKLPIGEYMTMQSRSVLAVNHVVEIMLRWLETGDWGEAFLRVIPKRKEAKLKVSKNGDGVDDGSVVEAEDAEAEALDASEDEDGEGDVKP